MDVQGALVPAPKNGVKMVQMDEKTSNDLAYYKTSQGPPGVFAPRGWYCLGTEGSGGAVLYIAPEPIKKDDLYKGGFTGPAVEASRTYGDTSGRYDVAAYIARVFPAHMAFVKMVIGEGGFHDFPSGPYPKDKMTYLGDSIVEYQTPPQTEGLGTRGSVKKNNDPINGGAILQKSENLLVVTMRLPRDANDLTSTIIQQFERDNIVP